MARVEVGNLACASRSSAASLSILIGLEGMALGGCPINALDLGRALRKRGHRVSVFAIDEDVRVSYLPYAKSSGFPITVLPAGVGHASRAWQIRKLAARESADIIHVFAPWLGRAASIATASRQRRSAIVTNWMMRNVSYVPQHTPMIVGTPMLREEAEQSHRGRVWLMEPPVDLIADHPDPLRARRFRQETGIDESEVAAVLVSRLDSHMKAEGIGYAIRAVRELDIPRLRLVVVGDGNAFDDLGEQAERTNTELGRRAVVLTGAMQDPRPAYAGADITLGMGGSALRALAHAKPLIVLGERGFARVFEPASKNDFYKVGFFGDRRNNDPVGHLATQLRELLNDDRRRALGEFGLAEVRTRFGLETSAEKLEGIYRASLESTPNTAVRLVNAMYLQARTFGDVARDGTWGRERAEH
jgi:glycosyltransferase involved in cell wall biosynthesis